jgi:hypothetical protein
MATKKAKGRATAAKPGVALHKHASGATALQVQTPDGTHVVACENLRVLITKQDGAWLAQGLEIDYAIDGESIPEVKQRFQNGLAMTIESNIRVNGDIRDLLRTAPQEVWRDYFDAKNTLRRYTHSQVMISQLQQHLPFDQILWVGKEDEAA